MMFEYSTVYNFLRKGGLILSDDINQNKAFFDFCQEKKTRRMVSFGNFGGFFKN
jgi:hypothetical protein